MSSKIASQTVKIEVNGQTIEIDTLLADNFCSVGYALKSEKPLEPVTVALTLYLMCKDICTKCNIEIDEIKKDLVESDDMH